MMTFDQIATATIDQLNAELGDQNYTADTIADARRVLAIRIAAFVGVDLIDSETNEVIRRAECEEAAESANAGPEGHIMADGRKCYVA
jgi:hypothetical protein